MKRGKRIEIVKQTEIINSNMVKINTNISESTINMSGINSPVQKKM